MMNILGLGLVLSSLVTAGVWSPSPNPAKQNSVGDQDVIVKEGHRVVVVEYEKETHGSTKVSISPPDKTQLPHKPPQPQVVNEKEKKKVKEPSSVQPNKGQSVSQSPIELVCDALGKCKHKIAGAVGKTKERVSETVDEATEKAHRVEERAKEAVSEAKETVIDKSKEIGGDLRRKAEEKAEVVEKRAKEGAIEATGKAKESVSDKAQTIVEKWKEMGREVQRNVSRAMEPTMRVAHLLGFSTAYGTCVWVTFFSSYVCAGALPRQQFGMVQSKIYPVYFRALASSVLIALAGHLFAQRKRLLLNEVDVVQAYNLLASLLMVLFNLLYLEPRVTKVMFERMKVEKEEGGGRDSYTSEPGSKAARDDPINIEPPGAPDGGIGITTRPAEKNVIGKSQSQIVGLSENLKELNGYSSFFNILTLMSLTWHLVYLAQNLHGTT